MEGNIKMGGGRNILYNVYMEHKIDKTVYIYIMLGNKQGKKNN